MQYPAIRSEIEPIMGHLKRGWQMDTVVKPRYDGGMDRSMLSLNYKSKKSSNATLTSSIKFSGKLPISCRKSLLSQARI